jgi:hypothetical protein
MAFLPEALKSARNNAERWAKAAASEVPLWP